MNAIAFVLMGLCTAWSGLGIASVLRVTSRTSRDPRPLDALPPVTVLKPLCGADPDLEANLESFFTQDHPGVQLVFGVQRADDPAAQVVRELMARHPQVNATLVVHDGQGAANPKIDNLLGMLPLASHDLLLISDSNVRVPPSYVVDMVRTYGQKPNTGLVTSLFAGTSEDGLGSALENVQLNGFCASGAALPTLMGDALVVGKSMLFSRSAFEAVGGFARVREVLAEDFVMGKMFQHAGLRVRIAPTVVQNVTRSMTLRAFLRRQQRWAMLRAKLRPAAQISEIVTSPLAMLPAAWAVMGPAAITWALALLALRDVGGWIALRGFDRVWVPLLLSPMRELCLLVVWLRAPLKRHVDWRGRRVRLGPGTLVYAPATGRGR